MNLFTESFSKLIQDAKEAKRIGRAKAKNPLSFNIATRVDKECHSRILSECKTNGIKEAEFLRRACEHYLDFIDENNTRIK